MKTRLVLFALAATLAGHPAHAQQPMAAGSLPHLERRGKATQLIVDGKPFLLLGGETHNSSSSSVDYMKPIWPRLAAMHLNTVLLPVAWETVEPQEGQFNFQCVDGLLEGARQNHLHLVILWFGAWKNTFSGYAPGWVKTDVRRFPRVQMSSGQDTERLSPFSSAVREADGRAFARLMGHLKEVDGGEHTVLMVQVENEVGVIPESRDYSATADAAFDGAVPALLMRYLDAHRSTLNPTLRTAWETAGAKTAGSWQEVFGSAPLTDDLFMAWTYASYVEQIAKAGKAEYPLPMYANAALIRPNYEPGQYNSGGPLPHSMDLWKAAAPSLDFLAPDIYFNDFVYWATEYARPDNPLFIPETQGGSAGAANAFYAFGQLGAMGFSPFGVDDRGNAPIDLVGISAPSDSADKDAIRSVYAELANLGPLILEKQQSGAIAAAVMENEAQRGARLTLGDYTANIVRSDGRAGDASRIGVMLMQTGPNEYLLAGRGNASISFSSDKPGPPIVGIESIDEEFFKDGAWRPERRLNGDEDSQGQALHLSTSDPEDGRIYRVRLYRY